MTTRRLLLATTAALFIATPVLAQGLPRAQKPEEVGLSSDKLKRFAARLKEGVDKGEIPGAVAIVVRNGKVAHLEAAGFRDREEKAEMKPDAIFRIASMTKPVVSLAIMMLAEEGRLSIAHPVSNYIPEFAKLQVGVEKKNADGTVELALEPQRRQMTIQDLLRHTSGLTYGVFDKSLVDDEYRKAGVLDRNQTTREFMAKLIYLPLKHQPGTTWEYSVSTDVLGWIVEVVSGKSVDDFIAERITKPLKMPDTGFWVEAKNKGRLAEPQKDAQGQRPVMRDALTKPSWPSGGGGMVSTAADYARFGQFWLNGGQLDGVRLISRKTVELMVADHLPPGTKFNPRVTANPSISTPSPAMGQGFGLGFAVRTDQGRNPMHGSLGEYYWAGATGTNFVIDPKEKMVVVLMMQAPTQGANYRSLMRQFAHEAIAD